MDPKQPNYGDEWATYAAAKAKAEEDEKKKKKKNKAERAIEAGDEELEVDNMGFMG
jgi:hypothetical protein